MIGEEDVTTPSAAGPHLESHLTSTVMEGRNLDNQDGKILTTSNNGDNYEVTMLLSQTNED